MAKNESNVFALIVIVYYAVNVFLGLGLMAVGAWFHASQDVHAYITVFVRTSQDSSLRAAAALILVAGIVLFIISILGIVGAVRKIVSLTSAHLWLQSLVLIFGLIAGFMTVALYWDTHMNVKSGMVDQLQQKYGSDDTVTKAWDRIQVKKRCCGVDGSWDYEKSEWFNSQNPIDAKVTVNVPQSCCALNFNQDQWLYWVDPAKLQLKDEKRCQEDAAGRINNSANLNRVGCYAALFYINRTRFWHDVTIFSIMGVIQGLGLGVGFLQIFGFVLDFIYLSQVRRTRSGQPY